MDKELYFGVDVSKKTLDLAYYDGETIDWKNAHIQVSNDDAGFKKIGSWVAKVGKDFDTFLFCMEYTGLYNQNFRLWLESKEYIYGMVEPRKMHRFEPDLDDDQRSLDRIKTDELDAFSMSKSALRAYAYRHKIPTKREYGRTYYSKEHLEELRRTDLMSDDSYYTTEQVQQLYGLTSANICHIVRVHHISKVKVGVKNLLLKTDVQRVMAERAVSSNDFSIVHQLL